MPATTFVYPYRAGSRSARALSEALGGRLIRRENSRFRPSRNKSLINWGSTDLPETHTNGIGQVFNLPEAVRSASNKRMFFQRNSQAETPARTPDWTLDQEVARGWLQERANQMVFARTILAGHSGEGIVKITNEAELEGVRQGTLLVKYVKKVSEFRVHVGRRGDGFVVIDTQQKLRRTDVPDDQVDFQVRNHANGFVFARNDIEVPGDVFEQALLAAAAMTDLDFGAVDVIYNERHGEAYVIEINTAPGLEGSTVQNYARFFESVIN